RPRSPPIRRSTRRIRRACASSCAPAESGAGASRGESGMLPCPAHLDFGGSMSSARAFARTSRLALVTATLMFGLIVIGSIVRTTGSGLACPDWPLCQGQIVPPFQFNVLIEWFHRLVALLVSLLLFA